jgi:hypothetical protein
MREQARFYPTRLRRFRIDCVSVFFYGFDVPVRSRSDGYSKPAHHPPHPNGIQRDQVSDGGAFAAQTDLLLVERDYCMKFSSSPLLMFRQFVLALFPISLITYLLFWFGMNLDVTTRLSCIAVIAPLLSLAYVLLTGRARALVTDDEVIVSRPFAGEKRFSRKELIFTSRVVRRSTNGIPTDTERILVAHGRDGEREPQEIVLTNFSKKFFDAVMGILLKDRVMAVAEAEIAAEAGVSPEALSKSEFIVPKAGMRRDFLRMLVVFFLGGFLLSVAAVGIVAYMLADAGGEVSNMPLLVVFGGVMAMIVGVLGVVLLITYRRRGQNIPDAVKIADDSLTVGDECFLMSEIRRVVATPPEYAAGNFVGSRSMSVWTDKGKTTFNLGVRAPGGVWKTALWEYGELCNALEKTFVRQGVEFSYDL